MHAIPESVQRRWLRTLATRFELINEQCLDGQLQPPQFALDEATKRLGRWDPATRTIGLSIRHLLGSTWLDIELTLRHEMAHMAVHELFDRPGAAPHGALFEKSCRLLKIESSPRAKDPMTEGGRKVLDRVRKLMTLAGSDNPHEAQLAMAAANKLLLKHNLELPESNDEGHYSWRWVGTPTGRVGLDRKLIATILQEHFFVQCLWVSSSRPTDDRPVRLLELLGAPHNLELAEYVHDYLTRTLDVLWKERRKTHSGGNAARNAFRTGILMGFRDHLAEQKVQHDEQGLIWLGDPALADFLHTRYPRTRKMRASTYRAGADHSAGRAIGRKLRIRPGVGEGPTNRGRRLPPAR